MPFCWLPKYDLTKEIRKLPPNKTSASANILFTRTLLKKALPKCCCQVKFGRLYFTNPLCIFAFGVVPINLANSVVFISKESRTNFLPKDKLNNSKNDVQLKSKRFKVVPNAFHTNTNLFPRGSSNQGLIKPDNNKSKPYIDRSRVHQLLKKARSSKNDKIYLDTKIKFDVKTDCYGHFLLIFVLK